MGMKTTLPDEQRGHFLSLLKKFHTAMLITHAPDHGFHARPMALADVEDCERVWFFSAKDTAKIREIELDSTVHLTAQSGDSLFLAMSGHATLIGDREKIGSLWREPFRVWFPGGKDDPSLELIAVRIRKFEFWDGTGLNRCRYLWESVRAYMTGTTPDTEGSTQHGSGGM